MSNFTIRTVPVNLHDTWRVVSSLKSISMRLYVLKALRRQLEVDIDLFKQDGILQDNVKKKLTVA